MRRLADSLLCGFLLVFGPAGLSSAPALQSELPISIHYRADWNTDRDGKQHVFEKGSCSVHVYGKVKRLKGETPGFAQYVPHGVTASFTYREEIIGRPPDGNSKCRGVIGTVTGSGLLSIGKEFSAEEPALFLQVFSGPLGLGALMQAAGDNVVSDPEAVLKRMMEDPSRAMYAFNVLLPLTLKVKERPGCESLNTATKLHPINLSGVRELGRSGMEGNFSWDTNDEANLGGTVLAVGERVQCGPKAGKQKMGHATLAWGLGQVEPSVALFLIQDGERVEVTDEEVDVLAGRKVRLEAVAFPYKDDGTSPQWTLPPTVIAGLNGYDQDMSRGGVIRLDEAAKRKPAIAFFCLDGGRTAQVSYSATVRGKKVEGKTRLKVHAPTATLDVIPERSVTIGKILPTGPCEVYLGMVSAVQSLPGLEIKASVRFPAGFEEEEKDHELAYVQLVKETTLDQKRVDYFMLRTNEFALDTEFPYAMLKGKTKLDMNDTPSDSISNATTAIHHFQAFRTTLLVRPGRPGEAIWLPLETVPWEWKFSLERIRENPGWDETCDPANFRIYGKRLLIPGARERFSGQPEDVPHWNRLLNESSAATSFRDEGQWQREVEAFNLQ